MSNPTAIEGTVADFPSSSESESSPKHDGFLKSVWNKLTDSPSSSKDGSEGNQKNDSSEKKTPKDKDSKKESGTGV